MNPKPSNYKLKLCLGSMEESSTVPEELRCKRSDGKQWRCSALSMPDKTVCEKHYIQAKKRAANSALRASLKKSRRIGAEYDYNESEIYLERKSGGLKLNGFAGSVGPVRRYEERERVPVRLGSTSLARGEVWRGNEKYANSSVVGNKEGRRVDSVGPGPQDYSGKGSESSNGATGVETVCHQCGSNGGVTSCVSCDRRGYCYNCISKWYPEISADDIRKVCPACRGICNCRVCLQGDNLIKAKVQEIPCLEKLKYLHSLLVYVLPVLKQIYSEQCFEIGLEAKIYGSKVDIMRAKINADQQMFCDFCKTPIFDYHRHCMKCQYDLCLTCCRDLRQSSELESGSDGTSTVSSADQAGPIDISHPYPTWKPGPDGSIPCGPHETGGCGSSSKLILRRILKLNWVAKLVKNAEEMVNGCMVNKSSDSDTCDCCSLRRGPGELGLGLTHCSGKRLYRPLLEEVVKREGIGHFRKHWVRGEPVLVRNSFEISLASTWDPLSILRGIQDTTDEEQTDDDSVVVRAVDCSDQLEVDIGLNEFIRGYTEGRRNEDGGPHTMKLTNWPAPNVLEEFLHCQRPEFLVNFPLVDFVHPKWGVLNLAAKLPHDASLPQVGPILFIAYGSERELGRSDSVNNLQINMGDVAYMLMHTAGLHRDRLDEDKFVETKLCNGNTTVFGNASHSSSNLERESTGPGAIWDVFCREDVPKLNEFLGVHWKELATTRSPHSVKYPVYDQAIYLNTEIKRLLKDEYGIEPWTFTQQIREAVFIPAGCPFQVKNLQSSVQLALDFLSPESLNESVRMAQEIRSLPNDHDAKLNMMEVGKMSLYAASSAIREIQKISLDPKLNLSTTLEDRNLTEAVSKNLAKITKRAQVACN